MSGIANYCPDEVSVLLAGFIPASGFIEGTFVDISKDTPPFSSVVSADGTVSRLYNDNSVYTIALTLMSTSDTNDALTKLWQLDEITQRGKFPLLIKDKSGSDLFFSTTTWIEGLPGIVKTETIEGRTWVLKSSQAVINIGGNAEPSGIINDLVNTAVSALPSLRGVL